MVRPTLTVVEMVIAITYVDYKPLREDVAQLSSQSVDTSAITFNVVVATA
jgi:hypothetical protein